MIGAKNTPVPDTSWNCDFSNKNDLNMFRHLILVRRDFEFATFEDWYSKGNLEAAFATKKMILIPTIYNVTPLSEASAYFRTLLDYDISTFDGTYMFRIDFLYYFDFGKMLYGFNGSDYDIMFVDINKNMIAYSPDGIKVKGAQLDLIHFEKIAYGPNGIKYLPLYLQLHDSKELNQFGAWQKLDYNIKKLIKTEVEILNVQTPTESTMTFRVETASAGLPVENLISSNFIILDDDNGELNIGALLETSAGEYSLSGINPVMTLGSISILTNIYSGSANYSFQSATIDITFTNSIVKELPLSLGTYEFFFTAKNTATNENITDIGNGEVTLTDDVIASYSPDVTYLGNGNYSAVLGTRAMSTGTIDINKVGYTGSDPYTISIVNIDITLPVLANPTLVRVVPEYLGTILTAFTAAYFFVTDDVIGAQTIVSAPQPGVPGYYLITFTPGPATYGDVGVSTPYLFGTIPYAQLSVPIDIINLNELSASSIDFSAVLSSDGITPVELITAQMITFVDQVTGSPVVGTLTEPSPGDYELRGISPDIANGVMTIAGTYEGSANYAFESWKPVANGGGANTSDWIDPLVGFAAKWFEYYIGTITTGTIVTGNGFIGNAQNVVANTTLATGFGSDQVGAWMQSDPIIIPIGTVRIRIKYRKGGTSAARLIANMPGLSAFLADINGNAAVATAFEGVNVSTGVQLNRSLEFYLVGDVNNNDWYAIDEVELYY